MMTHEQWIALSEEQQNEMVAIAAGWNHVNIDEPNSGYCPGQEMPGLCALPNFVKDLNAMHRAEDIFVQEDGCVWGHLWNLYTKYLSKVCFMSEPVNCLARATAAQRAEAFVMAMQEAEEKRE